MTSNRTYAWGTPGAVRIATCDDGAQRRTIPVAGTPHVDGVTHGEQVVYTRGGSVYFETERLGTGHDARIISHETVWIDRGRVVAATPDTPAAPVGELAPARCV
jgi:hypothetical protein